MASMIHYQLQDRMDAARSQASRTGNSVQYLRVSVPFHEANLIAQRYLQWLDDLMDDMCILQLLLRTSSRRILCHIERDLNAYTNANAVFQ